MQLKLCHLTHPQPNAKRMQEPTRLETILYPTIRLERRTEYPHSIFGTSHTPAVFVVMPFPAMLGCVAAFDLWR
jgi:hypothetical protein